jgi:hypothetical protein
MITLLQITESHQPRAICYQPRSICYQLITLQYLSLLSADNAILLSVNNILAGSVILSYNRLSYSSWKHANLKSLLYMIKCYHILHFIVLKTFFCDGEGEGGTFEVKRSHEIWQIVLICPKNHEYCWLCS